MSKEQLQSLRVSGQLTKPLLPTKVAELLAALAAGESLLETSERLQQEAHRTRRERILLVEDNLINQEVALGVLKNLGYRVDIASNGEEAIKALRSPPAGDAYKLVLMDCQMPVMDGYEASTRIRSGFAGVPDAEIPIIAMTANAMRGDREKCLDAGMSDYLSKPVDEAQLEAKLGYWLGAKDTLFIAAAEPSELLHDPEFDELPVWDREAAMSRLGGKPERLQRLLALFADETIAYIEAIDAAMEAPDLAAVRQAGHTLAGVAANLSALKLGAITEALVAAARNEDMDRLPVLWMMLREQYYVLLEQLQQTEF
jgi:CheY-like chemotaxis protein